MVRRLLISLALGSLLLCIGIIYFTFFAPQVVTYDGVSFSPSTIIVERGKTVTFKNNSGEAFWPASNLHPSHLEWSDFDPKKPIEKGEAWSFTFTQPGNWQYHDHINPAALGIVRVRNENGEVEDLYDCTLDANKVRCWERDIATLLAQGNVEGTFKYIELHESDPKFLQNCHALVHGMGKAAYALFSSDQPFAITKGSTYCGYGFFHGFMEALLTATGDPQEAVNFCKYVKISLETEKDAKDACYHGIGHGAVDGGDPRTWGDAYGTVLPALTLCEKVAITENEEIQCGNGVFDGLVTAYKEQGFGFDSIPETFFELCAKIDNLQFRDGCYQQLNPLAAFHAHGDIEKAFSYLNAIDDERGKAAALGALVGTFAKSDMAEAEYEPIINACQSLEGDLIAACIGGFVKKLMEYGTLETGYEIGINFCRSPYLQEDQRRVCFSRILTSFSIRKVACAAMAPYTDTSKFMECQPAYQPL